MSQELYDGYVPTKSKVPQMPFKRPAKLLTLEEVENYPEYAGRLADNVLMLDFDTRIAFDKFLDIVEALQLNCRAEQTTKGGHVYFYGQGNFTKCGTKIKLSIGLECDIKVGSHNSISRLKCDGKKHQIIYDIEPDEDYEPVPAWLTPLNKSARIPDFLTLSEGGRNQALFNYVLTLENFSTKKLSHSDIIQNIKLINDFIVPDKLDNKELKSILRDEAFTKPEIDAPEIDSAYDLMQLELKPIEFIVKDLLPVGLNILAGQPKAGKSWLSLDLALSVSSGTYFLGNETKSSTIYYLALEDSKNRLQNRIKKLLGDTNPSKDFYYALSINDLSNGLIEQLEQVLNSIPDCKLIIIDTLQYIRGVRGKTDGVYDYDYNTMKQLKRFADAHELSILVIHHTRKDINPNDPFANISGTNGITGACDTMLVLAKEERSSNKAKLSITGRDVDQQELMLTMSDCKWICEGNAEDIRKRNEELSFRADPFFNTINDLLLANGGKWDGTCQEILDHAEELGFTIISSKKSKPAVALGMSINNYDSKLYKYAGIKHQVIDKNGTAGKRHMYYLVEN